VFDAVHHIAYVVPDREAALALFQEKLGMTPFKIWESEEEGNAYAALQIGDTDSYLEIICPTNDEVSKFASHLHEHGPSVHHVAFRDDAMDETLAALSGDYGITGTDPIVSSSDWRISFLDTDKTLGVGLQLVDGRHL
jgi:catechol 2,3-dioxygenase-like lactoylglutathione lyase family enzyme